MNGSQLGEGLGSLFGGIFGSGGKGYNDAMKQYSKYFNKGAEYQQPFFDAGKGAIPDFQEWLKGMSDPSEFINNLMGNYKESDYSKYLQDQSMKAGNNAASANGLAGSTPFLQQIQENSGNIASKDMNQWLQNVLGINSEYGGGLNNLMGMGQNSANQLTELFKQLGQLMGGGAFGKEQMEQKKQGDIFGGLGNIFGSFF